MKRILKKFILFILKRKLCFLSFAKLSKTYLNFIFYLGDSIEKDRFRKNVDVCPCCLGVNVKKVCDKTYFDTICEGYGLNIKDFFSCVEEKYWFVKFDLNICDSCDFVYVPSSYVGLVERTEQSRSYLIQCMKSSVSEVLPIVDDGFIERIFNSMEKLTDNEMRLKLYCNAVRKYCKTGGTLLDLGANQGSFSAIFNRFGYKVCACETNKEFASLFRKNYPHIRIKENFLHEFNKETLFDFVFCSHVIEHIWDLDCFVSSIEEHINLGGYLFIATPNLNSLETKVLGKCSHIYILPHHCQVFSYRSLNSLMKRFGFVLVDQNNVNLSFWSVYKKGKL